MSSSECSPARSVEVPVIGDGIKCRVTRLDPFQGTKTVDVHFEPERNVVTAVIHSPSSALAEVSLPLLTWLEISAAGERLSSDHMAAAKAGV